MLTLDNLKPNDLKIGKPEVAGRKSVDMLKHKLVHKTSEKVAKKPIVDGTDDEYMSD